jgi:hypothetical protein
MLVRQARREEGEQLAAIGGRLRLGAGDAPGL